MERRQLEWLREVERSIQEDYERLHAAAQGDPQRAGHGGESTWVRVLSEWLPPSYEVAARKYILPEEGDDVFETDIVVFRPSYPPKLRDREEVLPGGVAAAFSVRLTADAAALRDGVDRAVRLRRGLKPRLGSPRSELLAPFPVGLLCHTHSWKSPGSDASTNVHRNLIELDRSLAAHPRESLDLTCVADLGLWDVARIPFLGPGLMHLYDDVPPEVKDKGLTFTAVGATTPDSDTTPVGALLAYLLIRLAHADPTVEPLADNLRLVGLLGSGGGPMRFWQPSLVLSEEVHRRLLEGVHPTTDDWQPGLW